ncbi:ATP-binding cassette domain-containing protein [Kutzneria kofuensis]|uniref:ATP-binding cassette domain-containing protein n=1 Tax=Kutzneria kofuensis TaxID=103725 RepID=UPI0031EB1E1F
MFQHASLYPWRTVLDNVLFGPQVQGKLTAETRRRAEELLEIVGLAKVAKKYPHELSGGMRQRVNLAPRPGDGTRRCCCWTSRSGRWTRRPARTCRTSCCGSGRRARSARRRRRCS